MIPFPCTAYILGQRTGQLASLGMIFIGERTLERSRVLACGFFFRLQRVAVTDIRPTYWPISGTAICWMSCNDVSDIRGIQASHFSEGPGAF
jgi:hypothetical protein